ncbi:hypothetical protein GCM10023196_058470 [Actinoallomurus vinaceus]|uniref:Uncharacterized protein n=1 Tax=Actinoallomurus vinaceus TaxID=1080074 RepID=A0ABP8UFJ4_9ACTN
MKTVKRILPAMTLGGAIVATEEKDNSVDTSWTAVLAVRRDDRRCRGGDQRDGPRQRIARLGGEPQRQV